MESDSLNAMSWVKADKFLFNSTSTRSKLFQFPLVSVFSMCSGQWMGFRIPWQNKGWIDLQIWWLSFSVVMFFLFGFNVSIILLYLFSFFFVG